MARRQVVRRQVVRRQVELSTEVLRMNQSRTPEDCPPSGLFSVPRPLCRCCLSGAESYRCCAVPTRWKSATQT